MKKNRGFGKSHSWGHSNSVFNFLKFKFYYVWCIWKKRNIISENLKKIYIYTWFSHYQWSSSPMKIKNQDLHDLFLETLFWINLCPAKNLFKLQIFGSLAGLFWWISLVHRRDRETAKISPSVEKSKNLGKSILQVPDTGTRVLDNTRPFLRSSIVSFWITPARSIERKYHIFRQYWYTTNVPVFNNTGTFQYLGPEVYFFQNLKYRIVASTFKCYQ